MKKPDLSNLVQQATHGLGQLAQNAQNLANQLRPEDEPAGQKPTPVLRRVLVIIYAPSVPSEGGRRLWQVLGWNDPDALIPEYIRDLREISHGYANYEVVERIEVDRCPVKLDGFAYQADDFVRCIRQGAGFHDPDAVDYQRILEDFDIVGKVNRGLIDEVWLFAFPYAGFYESIMGGPGAFWCNAPPLKAAGAKRRFVIMGYNYQRGVGEMLENMGHRAESIIEHAYRQVKGEANLWERFTRYDQTHPGKAEVGWMHFAPNSTRDYEWGRQARVPSRWHTWQSFPNLDGAPQEVDCPVWGGGDIREHHRWWFRLLPHVTGAANGVAFNWWRYVIDPGEVP